MNSYLHFTCGDFQLLLTASCIVEVGESSANPSAQLNKKNQAKTAKDLYRIWRGRSLPLIDLGRCLQLDSSRPKYQLVVYESAEQNESELIILDIEDVIGLVELEDKDFVDFAELNQQVAEFFDKSYIHPIKEVCLLRMNYPFSWLNLSSSRNH